MINRLRPIILGGLLLALPLAAAPAKNVKPDPNGLPPHDVQDLHYGDVLFYFYQDDYFDSITRLLAARQLDRIPHTAGRGGAAARRLVPVAGRARRGRQDLRGAARSKNTSEAVRNKAWFYLGKVWYQRGYLEESERALRQVSDKIEPRISAERYMLLAQLMMRQGRYDDAIAALSNWHGRARLDRLRAIQPGRGAGAQGPAAPRRSPYLDRVGRDARRAARNCCRCRDKANLALGFALLQAQRAAEAKPILQRVRLEGPYSSKALLGVGWADAGVGEFKRALVPWLALRKRSLLDSAVQESFLTVPYAYNQLSATGPGRRILQLRDRILRCRAEADRRFDRADPQRQPARPAAERRQEGHAHLVLAAEDAARRARVALPVPAAGEQRIPGRPEELPRTQFHEPQSGRLAR